MNRVLLPYCVRLLSGSHSPDGLEEANILHGCHIVRLVEYAGRSWCVHCWNPRYCAGVDSRLVKPDKNELILYSSYRAHIYTTCNNI